jgi:membrane-bound lytic murein transglycosylase D
MGICHIAMFATMMFATPVAHADEPPHGFDVPVEVNPWVEKWIAHFTGPGRVTYKHWLNRAQAHRSDIETQLEQAGLPLDLLYLAMIESGFTEDARSHAGAVGVWQFMPATAREYGLRVDAWVDERLDPDRSTGAAIEFLGELYARYQNWHLAWAAYNCGSFRLDRAIQKAETADFWELVEARALPAETRAYVPKLIAAAIIGHDPERYGFVTLESVQASLRPWVSVDASVGLDVATACYRTNRDTVERLNPHLVDWTLPPDGTPVQIRMPVATARAARCLRRIR